MTSLMCRFMIRKVEQDYNIIAVRIVQMSSKKLLQPLLQKDDESKSYQTIGFLPQVWLLTFKNLLITFKNPKNIIFLTITPFLLGTFLYFFQSLALDNGNILIPNPQSSPLPAYPKCGWNDCVSVDIRVAAILPTTDISTSAWASAVYQDIVNRGYDVKLGTQAITDFASLQKYYDQLEANTNRTQAGILFCLDNTFPATDNFTNFCNNAKDHSYYLVLKKINTMATIFHAINQPFPLDLKAAALKNLVDNAILNYQLGVLGKVSSNIQLETSRFPLGPNRYIQNYDIVTAIGAFYFMITPLFVFLFIQNEIVREKQYKLRQGLNIFGASHTAYWISWFLITLIYAMIASVTSFLAGYAFGFGFFTETPAYIIILMMFFPFNLSLAMIGFFVASIAPNSKASNTASYAIVLLAIVVQSFVSDNNLLTFIFTTNPSTLVGFLRAFLVIYPPFSYTKIFTNITIFSGYHFDITQRAWIPGKEPYNWDLFTRTTSGPLPFGGGSFERYSDLQSMGILYADAALYAFLTWYFDHVISSNRGRGESLLFPIKKIIKLFKGKKQQQIKRQSINIRAKAFGDGAEESAIKQRNRVYQNSERNIPALGLRIKCLSKTFKGTCSKKEMHAINELTVQIEPNELMAVLGHNGAGKTTLINILTGILDPDDLEETQIIINRENINNIDEIRKHIGLCAQFDILWNELTAEQHLDLFAQLKGIPKYERKEKIQELLEMVSLGREGKNEVRGFSGGMRRRLSLAIASVGDPRIILLDEPTTGLDPKVRQQVWRLIEKMKKTRSIILTTHSMEEADVLSDRVCVMVKGRIKCIGTTVFLKQEYGLGHRLTLNIDRKEVKAVQDTLKKLCPSAVIVDYKGGNLVVGINEFDNLLKLIKMLESEESHGLEEYDFKKSIRDWNVSDATLEEVFMAVSKEKDRE